MKPFKLERYFAKHEFNVKYNACASDCEPVSMMSEVVANADDECQELWQNLNLGYTESQGLPLLRQEIIKAMEYPSLTQDQILILAPEEGIYLTMRSLLQPNDHIIVIYPSYQSLYDIAQSIECDVSYWKPIETSDSKLIFDINTLRTLIKPNTTKLLVINFPHNPTGFIPSQNEFLQLIDICRSDNIYVFSDEMYRFLEYNPKDRLPAACEIYNKAISLSGMSKVYSMPGIRIGWIATQDSEVYKGIASFKDYTTICSSGPSEILALMGLRQRDKLIERNLHIIHSGLDAVQKFMQQNPDKFIFYKPKAGPIAFPKLLLLVGNTKKAAAAAAATPFCEDLISKAGILLLPGGLYDAEMYDDRLRISFGRSNIPEIMEKLHSTLNN